MTIPDTSKEAERVLADVYRQMPIAEKARRMEDLHQTASLLHAAGVRLRNPAATDREIVLDWMRITLEPELFEQVCEAMREGADDRQTSNDDD